MFNHSFLKRFYLCCYYVVCYVKNAEVLCFQLLSCLLVGIFYYQNIHQKMVVKRLGICLQMEKWWNVKKMVRFYILVKPKVLNLIIWSKLATLKKLIHWWRLSSWLMVISFNKTGISSVLQITREGNN